MGLTEGTSRDALGGIVIQSRMRMAPDRQGFEKQFFPGIEVGLAGWERAHSQGKITGVENPNAIRYAPSEVNQEFQRLGIERFIREIFGEKAPETEVWLTTVTYTHPMTLRLKEIQYRVDVVANNVTKTLFEASIEVEDKRSSPRVSTSGLLRTEREAWLPFLKNTAAKEKAIILEILNLSQRLLRFHELYRNEHKKRLEVLENSYIGQATNALFNSTPPKLEIWDKMLDSLKDVRTALAFKDVKKATKAILTARAHYLLALKKYIIWRDGTETAGKFMTTAIVAVAVIVITTAAGAYAASAIEARLGAAAGIGASVAAGEQTVIRYRIAEQAFENSIRAAEAIEAAEANLARYEAALAEYETMIESSEGASMGL